jgi:hypothetical protein
VHFSDGKQIEWLVFLHHISKYGSVNIDQSWSFD